MKLGEVIMIKSQKIEVLESNQLVEKYRGDIFRRNVVNYISMLEKKTAEEHRRQMQRIYRMDLISPN